MDKLILLSGTIFVAFSSFNSAVQAYNSSFVQYNIGGGRKCWQYVNSSGGRIFSHASRGRYADNTDCKVTISAPTGHRIYLRIEDFDLDDSINCIKDELIIYDGRRYSSPQLSGVMYGLCGSKIPSDYRQIMSTGREMTVRFITDGEPSNNLGFTLTYTMFQPNTRHEEGTDVDKDGCFKCSDLDMCVDPRLQCDEVKNCPDGSDEGHTLCYGPTKVPATNVPTTRWLSWAGSLLAFFFMVMYVVLIVGNLIICCCHQRDDEEGNIDDMKTSTVMGQDSHDPHTTVYISHGHNTKRGLTPFVPDAECVDHSRKSFIHVDVCKCSGSRPSDLHAPHSPRTSGDGSYGLTCKEESGPDRQPQPKFQPTNVYTSLNTYHHSAPSSGISYCYYASDVNVVSLPQESV